MTEGGVLVLNSLYQAIQVTGVRRAFRLFYAGRARAVDADFKTYCFYGWCELDGDHDGADVIRTPSLAIRIPRVIQLVRYNRLPRRELRFSRRNVFIRDKNRCQYCRRILPQAELNIDHVVPTSRGGRSTWENVVCACIRCNSRKGNRTPKEAAMRLLRPPRRPRIHPFGSSRWLRRHYDVWNPFLEGVHWGVEMCDEIEAGQDPDET